MKPRRFVKLFSLFIVLNLAGIATPWAQEGFSRSRETIPLREVTLYTSGVAQFLHRGIVTHDGEVTIDIPKDQMVDVIRTLTVIGSDGNPIRNVTFPAGEDPRRSLGRFRIDLNDVRGLTDLAVQARGLEATVQYRDGRSLTGIIAGAAADQSAGTPDGIGRDPRRDQLLLATEDAVFPISVDAISSLSFTDTDVQREFASALSVLSNATGPNAPQQLTIRLADPSVEGEELSVRYLAESPLWRTSYRGIFDGEHLLLQGWAHVDNTGSQDWEGVSLTLVAAQPVTYLADLYHPRYVERRPSPESEMGDGAGIPAAPFARMSLDSAMMESAKSSVQPEVAEEESITGITFTFTDPVTIARGRSAMVPIVDRLFDARIVRSFDPRRDTLQPRLTLAFENTSGRQLPDGVVTIFEGQRYVGDALLPVLFDGDEGTLRYAVDLSHTIRHESDTAPEELRSVTVVDGVLVEQLRLRRTTRYTIEARGNEDGREGRPERIRIAHHVPDGWEVVSPQPLERDGRTYTFLSIGTALTVTEERIRERRVALTAADQAHLLSYSSNRLIDPTVRRIIQNVVDLRRQLDTHRVTRREAERQLNEITSDQERIRQNMEPLERDSSLYRRYLRELESLENRLGIVREELNDARSREQTAEEALQEYLRTLQSQ